MQKQKMKTIVSKVRLAIAHAAVVSMTMMPVADGFAAEQRAAVFNEALVKQSLLELGLTKRQTLEDFWKQNKSKFPPGVQALMEPYVKRNSSKQVPRAEVSSVRGANGVKIPVVRFSLNNQIVNVELHNNEKFFAKVGGTELTQVNIQNFTDIFEKLYLDDPKFRALGGVADRRGARATEVSSANSSSSTQAEFGYPDMTKDLWKKMSPQDRVNYIHQIRRLWVDAVNVLESAPGQKNQKQKSEPKRSSLFNSGDLFSNLILGFKAQAEEDEAQPGAPMGAKYVPPKDACIVAGYVTQYKVGTNRCSVESIEERYSELSPKRSGETWKRTADESNFFKGVWQECKAKSQIACNPLVYGLSESGGAICVPVSSSPNSPFQIATHSNGPCEAGSALKGSSTSFVKDEKNQSKTRYDDRKVSDEQISDEIMAREKLNDFNQTSEFLTRILKARDKSKDAKDKIPGIDKLADVFSGKAELTDAMLSEIKTVKDQFVKQIEEAKEACLTSTRSGRPQERNFWGACDQMQRRKLFITEFLKQKIPCPSGSAIDSDTLKCKCSSGATVLPGAKSCGSSEGSQQPPGGSGAPSTETAGQCPGMQIERSGADAEGKGIQCVCPSGDGMWTPEQLKAELAKGKTVQQLCAGRPSPQTTAGADGSCPDSSFKPSACKDTAVCKPITAGSAQHSWQCPVGAASEDKPGWGTRILGWLEKAAPWLVIAGAIWWINKKAPKPPPLVAPPDSCGPGGTPCTGPCPNVNQTKINGVCQCRPDTDFDYVVNQQTCERATRSTTTPTEVTCGDGVTKAASADLCPKITCQDGTQVFVGSTCPSEVPSTKPGSSPAPSGVAK